MREDLIWAAHERLNATDTSISNTGYNEILPRPGDFVYADPPYDGVTENYGCPPFSQSDLAHTARQWQSNGCAVLLSNYSTDTVNALYQGFDRTEYPYNPASAPTGPRKWRTEVLIQG